jgi:hypothetical protein
MGYMIDSSTAKVVTFEVTTQPDGTVIITQASGTVLRDDGSEGESASYFPNLVIPAGANKTAIQNIAALLLTGLKAARRWE